MIINRALDVVLVLKVDPGATRRQWMDMKVCPQAALRYKDM